MLKNKQLIVSSKNGDCFRACISSILGLKQHHKLLNDHGPRWFTKWNRFLAPFGMMLHFTTEEMWIEGLWIASVKSKNFPVGTHAIVMDGYNVAFDPSTKKRYKTGESLLGKKVVVGGYHLIVTDASKLHKFQSFKKKLA